MDILEIRDSNPTSLQLFTDVAQAVYQDDPVWANASETVFTAQLPRRLKQSEGCFLPIVALDNGQPYARAVAILVNGAVGDDREPQGYIGFFECLENRIDAAQAVLNYCEQILQKAGARSFQVPKVDNQLLGCQISGFDLPHVCLTQHNPPYYLDFFTSSGYEIRQHIYSLYFTREQAEQVEISLLGFKTREFNRARLDEEIGHFHQMQQEIFSSRPGYIPRTFAEDKAMIEAQLPFIDDELIIFAEDAEGNTVGSLICLPDFYQTLGGQAINRARIISIGAIPKFANKGIGALMGAHLMKNLLHKKKYIFAEGSLILAHNIAPQNLAKRFHAQSGRRFAVLEKKVSF